MKLVTVTVALLSWGASASLNTTASCSFATQTDFTGNDLQPLGAGNDFAVVSDFEHRADSPCMTAQDCCDICAGYDGCGAFTMIVDSEISNCNTGTRCYLKTIDAKGYPTPCDVCTSGIVNQ